MKVLVLSRNARSYTTYRLAWSCRRLGHEVMVADPVRFTVTFGAAAPSLLHQGQRLHGVSVVVPRLPPDVPRECLAVLRQLESSGVPVLNGAEAISSSRDRLAVLQLLARRGLPTPPTAFCLDVEDVRGAVEAVGGPPVVLRLANAVTTGPPLVATSVDSAVSLVEAFAGVARPLVIQALSPHVSTCVRALVVGDSVVAAFRTDLDDFAPLPSDRPQPLRRISPRHAHARLAVAAARALGLVVASVDLVEHASGARVFEVDATPGLEAMESAAREDLSLPIAQLVLALGAGSRRCQTA